MCAADKEAGAQKKDSSQDAEAEAAKLQEDGVGGSKPSKIGMYKIESLLDSFKNIYKLRVPVSAMQTGQSPKLTECHMVA